MDNVVKYIESLGMFGMPPTLDRIKNVLGLFDNPQNNFDSVHIAGTNGKGSVTAMVSAGLGASGKKVGRFVSPHITDFCERISVNGNNIPLGDLERLSKAVIDKNVKLTEFEFITAVAFLYFAEQKVDIAVVETGLGGRLDATNSLTRKKISVITKLGLEHTAILGDTIEKIAGEKCGIINNDVTVTSPFQKTEALGVIRSHSKNLIIPDTKQLKVLSSDIGGNTFMYKGEQYETSLAGEYQTENALVSIEVLRLCGVDTEDIKKGLKNAFIPARLQVLSKKPLVVLDGAHNPDGADVLKEIMKKYDNITAVIGVMRDKDYKEILKRTLPLVKRAICVTPSKKERALSGEELKAEAEKYCPAVCFDDLKAAIGEAKQSGATVFIYGSLYLASDVLKLI